MIYKRLKKRWREKRNTTVSREAREEEESRVIGELIRCWEKSMTRLKPI